MSQGIAIDQAFAEFFHSSYRELMKTAMYLGATLHEADEATASTMSEVLSRWSVLDEPGAYARRAVASNFLKSKVRSLDRIRQRQVERGGATAQGAADPNLSVWEDWQWAKQLLQSLPPSQRDVLALVFDGYTPTEIAGLLGRSPAAVRQSLHAGRERLRKEVEPRVEEAVADTG